MWCPLLTIFLSEQVHAWLAALDGLTSHNVHALRASELDRLTSHCQGQCKVLIVDHNPLRGWRRQ